jgi:amidohydrolase
LTVVIVFSKPLLGKWACFFCRSVIISTKWEEAFLQRSQEGLITTALINHDIMSRIGTVLIIAVLLLGLPWPAPAQQEDPRKLHQQVSEQTEEIFEQVVEWRRHFHQNPELSNREEETAAYIADYLRDLGLKVKTGIAHTGVVGILEGGKEGPVVGLRADIDALPVKERADVPFKSTKTTTYLGKEVGVSHACGHDTHIAMLMGAAKILTDMKEELQGTVKFIFQPAEEGAPPGEEGGAELMVKEGVLENPDVDVVFGQHINSQTEVGKIRYRPKGTMAASDRFVITVKGKQTHGSTPWTGVDPIVTSAKIIEGLQTIISRQTELTKAAAVISVGKIEAGVRNNIIPEKAEMIGTIRTLDTGMQEIIHKKIRRIATKTAESMGATAEVKIEEGYPVTYNDPDLTEQMLPTLQGIAGAEDVILSDAITGAEDFSFFQKKVPGFYWFVGGMPKGMDPSEAPPHHTPDFYIEEEGMKLGVQSMVGLTIDYMNQYRSVSSR